MPKKVLAFILTAVPFAAFAQHNGAEVTSSEIMRFPKTGTLEVSAITEDYFPHLQHLEMPKPGGNMYFDYLQGIKSQIKPQPNAEQSTGERATLEGPIVWRQFEGNAYNFGAPNDNDMAISNGGKVVSVINSTVNFYEENGTLLKSVSLQAFSDTLKLTAHKYDPRTLYDPLTDRFVVVYLSGSNDSTSNIVVAFSQSNNPMGKWNFYSLPGEPLLDTTWTDYPILTLTEDELLITVNALQNNKSWQEGFKQSYIWQIDKNDGYQGLALDTRLRSGIKYNGKPIRNLCPVQGGSRPMAGNVHYFVSDRNFAAENDTVFLITLTGSVSDPSPAIDVWVLKSESGKYGVPPSAHQPSTHTFETNDARILDAFIENGIIQFVGNSVNKPTGKAGVMHGTITMNTAVPHLKINILGHQNLEFGYPGIAYAGDGDADDDAFIFVNHSSDTVPAGNSIFLYKNGEYSAPQRLKAGKSYVNVISGKTERWGDYSGVQRKYNELGVAWVAGSYGYKKSQFELLNGTWISQVKSPLVFQTGVTETQPEENRLKVYPSPLPKAQPVVVEFEAKKSGYADFTIYDMNGKAVHHLLTQKMKAGNNRFSFIPGPLKSGIYIIRISQNGERVVEQKFVVE